MKLDENTRIARVQAQARNYVTCGDFSGAETTLLRALRSAHLHTPECLFLWNELGMVYKYLGRFDKSRDLYRRALREAPGLLSGAERDFFLADLYHNLGGLEHARGRFRRGEIFARKGLQLRRRLAAGGGLVVAADKAALAALLDGQRKFTEAEELYRQVLRTYRRAYGASHAEIALVLNNLAALCQGTGRPKRAEAYYRASLAMKRQELGALHPRVAVTLNNLGMLYRAQGKARAAERCLGNARRLLLRSLGRAHIHTKAVRKNYQLIRYGAARRDHESN